MTKTKKATHGGKREGAGRKAKPGEKKKKYAVSLKPSEKKHITDKHGTLTKAILTTIPNGTKRKNGDKPEH